MLLILLQKIVNKTAEATVQLKWNKRADKIVEPKLIPEEKPRHVEETYIPPMQANTKWY